MEFPAVVTLETVADCNLACPYCSVHTVKKSRESRFMDIALFKKLFLECADHQAYIWVDYMGEPSLHPGFMEILDVVDASDAYVGMESNATLWTDSLADRLAASRLDRIIVTLEPNAALFKKYRSSSDFDKVVSLLKRFVFARLAGGPKLSLQMIANPENYAFREKFIELSREIGADETFIKPIMIHQFDGNEEYERRVVSSLWSDAVPSRYVRHEDGSVSLSSEAMASECPKLGETVVLSDGRVIVCCYDKQGRHCLGSVCSQTLKEVWDASVAIRENEMRHRTFDCCRFCLEKSFEDILVKLQ